MTQPKTKLQTLRTKTRNPPNLRHQKQWNQNLLTRSSNKKRRSILHLNTFDLAPVIDLTYRSLQARGKRTLITLTKHTHTKDSNGLLRGRERKRTTPRPGEHHASSTSSQVPLEDSLAGFTHDLCSAPVATHLANPRQPPRIISAPRPRPLRPPWITITSRAWRGSTAPA